MKKQSIDEISNIITEFNITHFKKVNFFGSSKVGKKTLISYIEHFSNKEEKFKSPKNEEKKENQDINENEDSEPSLVEDVKKISITYYEKKKLDINLYITNTDDTESIKDNLSTLLKNSECIILMIDITSTNSFEQISELMPLIYQKMKSNIEFGEVPMFFISNKLDLEDNRVVSGFEIKELLDNYTGISNYEISLNLDPNNANDDTINDFILKFCHTISESEKQYTFRYDSLNLVKICEPMTIKNDSILMKNIDNSINLLLLGSSSVGKTSFSQKLFSNKIKENHILTMGIGTDITVAELYGCLVKVEVWDTAGQERFRSIPAKYYSKCDGFLLLYDVNDKDSFNDIAGWIKDIRKARGNDEENFEKKTTDEILILIGNKIDKIGQRQVTQEEGIEFSKKYDVQYYETSCKLGINLYEILCDIIMQVSSLNRRESTNFALEQRKENIKNLNKKKKCC